MDKQFTPDQIIDALGGTSEVARICKVEPPSVSGWRQKGIPQARIMFLRLARPAVFRELEKSSMASARNEHAENPQ